MILGINEEKKLTKQGFDLDFIERVQPHGNINFKISDSFFQTGKGYHTILNVYQYPSRDLSELWLQELMLINGTRSLMPVKTEDSRETRKQLNRDIGEKQTRVSDNAKLLDNQRELEEIGDLQILASELESGNTQMSGFYTKIIVSAKTEKELSEKVSEIIDTANKFKFAIHLGELDYEYATPFVPPSLHKLMPNGRKATKVKIDTLAAGYFYNYTSLSDPHGDYYGFTNTNGAINWDLFHNDKKRTTPFVISVGKPKMGQEVVINALIENNFGRGNFIREVDMDGSSVERTRSLGGIVLSLSGAENRINPFQVFPNATNSTGEVADERRSFAMHITKMKNLFQAINNSVTGDDLTVFSSILTEFYISKGLWYRNSSLFIDELRITKVKAEECPTLSDFINYIYTYERQANSKTNTSQFVLQSIQRIKTSFEGLAQSHPEIFDGVTLFQDISKEKVVTFDFSGLSSEPDIFNAQLYSVLSLIGADIINNSKRNKQLAKERKNFIPEQYLLNIGAGQNLLDPNFPIGAQYLGNLLENMASNDAGLILSVRSLQGILFDSGADTGKDPYVIAVKKIFGLMQYRLFNQVPETDIPLLASALSGSMTEGELSLLTGLEEGQFFMSIANVRNLLFTMNL
ncbi:hypothetical protein FACS1894192_10120 [Bacilli bacterium]|nr:hypothetical protein FACS1894192_10120 [Bacilli bacterium]